MPKYMIEREVPGVGSSSSEEFREMAAKSYEVLKDMGGEVQWLESFATDDKFYCVYVAPNEEAIRKHAKLAGFPANTIAEVRAMLDPGSAELGDQMSRRPSAKPEMEKASQLQQ